MISRRPQWNRSISWEKNEIRFITWFTDCLLQYQLEITEFGWVVQELWIDSHSFYCSLFIIDFRYLFHRFLKKSNVPRHLRYVSFNLSQRSRKLVRAAMRYRWQNILWQTEWQTPKSKITNPRDQLPSHSSAYGGTAKALRAFERSE